MIAPRLRQRWQVDGSIQKIRRSYRSGVEIDDVGYGYIVFIAGDEANRITGGDNTLLGNREVKTGSTALEQHLYRV